jgi:hypothetical protein
VAGSGIEELNFALHISDNDSLLEGIKDPLKKTFLLSQPDKVILYFLRLYPPNPLDQFVQKT